MTCICKHRHVFQESVSRRDALPGPPRRTHHNDLTLVAVFIQSNDRIWNHVVAQCDVVDVALENPIRSKGVILHVDSEVKLATVIGL
jgi:hypothetical protein